MDKNLNNVKLTMDCFSKVKTIGALQMAGKFIAANIKCGLCTKKEILTLLLDYDSETARLLLEEIAKWLTI